MRTSVDRRLVDPARDDLLELLLVVGDAAAGAPEGVGGSDDEGKLAAGLGGNVLGDLESLGHLVRNARDGQIESDLEHRVLELLAVLAFLDGRRIGADELDLLALENASAHQFHGGVQGGLSAERRQQCVGPLLLNDLLDDLWRDWLDVGSVGELGIGHDGGRIRVHQHDRVAFLPQGLAGLHARIVEFAALTDDNGAGADDEDLVEGSVLGHSRESLPLGGWLVKSGPTFPLPSPAIACHGPRLRLSDNRSKALLVVPAFRESRRLPAFLERLCTAIADASALAGGVDVQVVDDGSGDREAQLVGDLVAELGPRFPFLRPPILLERNVGKGGAVYAGWDSAHDDHLRLAFVDADGAVSESEVVRVLAGIDTSAPDPGKDALFAARVASEDVEIRRTPLRGVLGRGFRLIVRLLFRLPCRDTQCGFKTIPAQAYRQLRPHLREHRFCFDVELAWCLHDAGFRIHEQPISWSESPGSRVHLGTALQMLVSLIRLRLRLRAGQLANDSEAGNP